MFCLPAGVIQGKVMKIKRGRVTHSINPCLITSDLIISDTDRNTPMHVITSIKGFSKIEQVLLLMNPKTMQPLSTKHPDSEWGSCQDL